MAKTKAARKHGILSTPTRPLEIDRRKNVAALLDKMQGVSFQGRNLGRALQVWERMKEAKAFVFLGISGALVPLRPSTMRFSSLARVKKPAILPGCPL